MTGTALLLMAALSLNGSWEFRFEEGKAYRDVLDPAFEATDTIPVPGCYDAMPKWYMKRGTGLYRKTFTLEKPVNQSWVVVDGMGLTGHFILDGKPIGTIDLPWSKVELRAGALAAGEHTLFAAVDNRFDWNYQKLVRIYYDFHCWGGFYHGVSLSSDNRKLFVRTRDYKTGSIEIEAVNFPKKDFTSQAIFDGKNSISITFRDSKATLRVPEFKLWSPAFPHLHQVSVDSCTARFGIRTIEAKNRGLYLNGEKIFLKGVNRHEQHVQFGASTPESLMIQDLQNLKSMGGNFIRGAHYPQSQRFLDLCDENGFLVWEESLGWGNGQGYTKINGLNELTDPGFIDAQLRETKLMVRNSLNHPSVIIFGFLNEFASATKEGKSLADRLIQTIKEEDSGRLVTFACNSCAKDISNEKTDIISVNTYPGTINSPPDVHDKLVDKIQNQKYCGLNWIADHFRKQYPEKPIIVSEIGTGGIYGSRDPSAPFYTEEFQAEYDSIVVETVYSNPDLAGITFWQFYDTRTSWRDCGRNAFKRLAMSDCGLFDRYRRPKMVVNAIAKWYKGKRPANLAK